jgi:hypothetical protein
MSVSLPRPRREIPIVETGRGPSVPFQQWIDTAFKQIEKSVGDINIALAAAGIALDQAGQALTVAIREVSTSGPVLGNDYIVLVDATAGNVVLDLPVASTNKGALVVVKKLDASANTVTLEANGAETIDGAANKVISTQYDKFTVVCDGVEWWVVG